MTITEAEEYAGRAISDLETRIKSVLHPISDYQRNKLARTLIPLLGHPNETQRRAAIHNLTQMMIEELTNGEESNLSTDTDVANQSNQPTGTAEEGDTTSGDSST